ncbi:MAG: electron transfer flavoprotein subunit beta/FixA family protein [Halobacteriaceae archaeon]
MKILVMVKEVAEVEEDFEIADNRIDERYLQYDLNEWDDYAIEEAVQLSESNEDIEVVTVTIGPERAEETIRMALAKGADRSIRIWDEELNRDLLDIETKTEIFATVVQQEDPDLILSGVQANDDSFGATGVALAKKIDYEWAAVVNGLDADFDTGSATVRRELEGGVEEITEVDLPAVLTIQTGINEPRYASLRGIRQAQEKEIATYDLSDISIEEETISPKLTLTSLYEPETESDTTYFEGDPEEQASQLADLLRERGVTE